jgi:NAD(P)-dependent dehydrogenase (short-subunit alcohol dehydrogenase family)
MRVRNSVAFVTGANRGIGLVFARELLAAGARKVYAAARRAEGIALDGVERVGLDVTKPDTVAAAARACTDVNLLVNNAGISLWSGFLSPEAVEAARLEMETNYFGPLALSRGFAPILAKNGGGAIVNVLSVLSWVAVPTAGTYSASKAAAWALTNWLRTGLREQGTQVLGVHAGPVDTDMARDLRLPKVNPVDVVQQVLRAIEAGRDEVLADEMTRQVKAGLSDEAGVYLNFDRTARMRQRAEPSATEGRKPFNAKEVSMPIAKIHVLEGRYDDDRLDKVSAAIQAALVNTLGVPPEDFYQLIFEFPRARFRHTTSFVGMRYSDDLIILDIAFIAGRPPETRLALLKDINTRVAAEAKVSPDDLMITIYECAWSEFLVWAGRSATSEHCGSVLATRRPARRRRRRPCASVCSSPQRATRGAATSAGHPLFSI